jgi:CO dehydrogenase nickel-insertion accessory protein CooC1
MIIGILGKGGSGKSTISTHLARCLASKKENKVLAIDADHNMDLTFNLGVEESFNYLGSSLEDVKRKSGLSVNQDYREALSFNNQGLFTLYPQDSFTQKYTKHLAENFFLMTAGPQTNDVLLDKACSHALFTSLKVYLPLLSLQKHEWVVIDEKAGADGASTGIPTGFDIALIVSEPTVHGMKTARQISELLDYYDVPYEFVINKMMEQYSSVNFQDGLGKKPVAVFDFDQKFTLFNDSNMDILIRRLEQRYDSVAGQRFSRSQKKFNTKK